MADQPQRGSVWTPANIVTLVRICFIPVFVGVVLAPWPEWLFPWWDDLPSFKPFVAAAVFAILAFTDSIDGYLARRRDEVTNLGKFMDPLADKMLVAAALLSLIELDVLPSWVALIILVREFIVSGVRMVAASEGRVIAASWLGKAKTVTQIIAILLFLIKDSHTIDDFSVVLHDWLYIFSWLVMVIALVLTIWSMIDYIYKARDVLGFPLKNAVLDSPDSAAAARSGAPVPDLTQEDLQAKARELLESAMAAGKTLGCAESCTGGLLSACLTAVPGSSSVFAGGVVSYSNDVKEAVLDVSPKTLASHGAVSTETACEMARGAKQRLGVDAAVSITGIAGPGGGSPEKPVGMVCFGLANGSDVQTYTMHFDGDRDRVRLQAADYAIGLLALSIQP